jgi:probable rRNA maturation factor
MLELEIFDRDSGPGARPGAAEIRRLCTLATNAAGVRDGHLAVEFVDPERITWLNATYRGKQGPTDVLSFPIDGCDAVDTTDAPDAAAPGAWTRELGDVVICLAHTIDVREAIVHGVLHLLGMDHERDNGEMLALQRELLAAENR